MDATRYDGGLNMSMLQTSLTGSSQSSGPGYRVGKSMGGTREHTENKRRALSCSIPESHVEKLRRDHLDPNAIPLRLGRMQPNPKPPPMNPKNFRYERGTARVSGNGQYSGS